MNVGITFILRVFNNGFSPLLHEKYHNVAIDIEEVVRSRLQRIARRYVIIKLRNLWAFIVEYFNFRFISIFPLFIFLFPLFFLFLV